jgi:hypothetical protein
MDFFSAPSSGTFLPFWFVLGFLVSVLTLSLSRYWVLSDRVCGVLALATILGLGFPPSRATNGGELLFEGWLLCAAVAVAWGFRRTGPT